MWPRHGRTGVQEGKMSTDQIVALAIVVAAVAFMVGFVVGVAAGASDD